MRAYCPIMGSVLLQRKENNSLLGGTSLANCTSGGAKYIDGNRNCDRNSGGWCKEDE